MALALGIRLAIWIVLPVSRFASDEESYFQVGTALLTRGHHDVFWPPVTGWLIALVRWIAHTDSLAVVRLVWIGMDVACVVAVQRIAGIVADAVWTQDAGKARRFETVAAAAYAVYLPAISHAQFATSETPALLLTLVALLLVLRPGAGANAFAGAGVVAGLLVLTRPSLLPLLVLVPLATALPIRAHSIRRGVVFVALAGLVVSANVYKNWRLTGELTLATNSAYNLYIGNREMYAEDLNLFSPVATPGQIEFRRQQWSGELAQPTGSPAEMQRTALIWIADHPATFARRALGRLARVFVPKTDVLELVGGERGAGITSPAALLLLGAVNVQWTLTLFGGILGLAALTRMRPELGRVFLATIAGALVLCLVAISKPRYSFVFDPLLLIGATLFMTAPRACLDLIGRIDRWVIGAVFAFLLWGWTAFLIFGLTSRAAL